MACEVDSNSVRKTAIFDGASLVRTAVSSSDFSARRPARR